MKDVFQIHIAKTTEHVEIAFADERIANQLDYEEGLPCFYIETIAEDANGKIVEYSRSFFRGDKTNFVIERNYPNE